MRRLVLCCIASVALYVAVFAFILDRPLSAGLLGLELTEKSARLAALPTPKLVILAGSNGPYSHACAVIGPMLNLPCENAGIAVGIGLDTIFGTYLPHLHAGDVVYMPMELQQYTITRRQNRSGVDTGILLRQDRAGLVTLPADRIASAIFCCSLADFLESLAEMPLARAGLISPQAVLAAEYNTQGDRIDTPLAKADPALLRNSARDTPNAAAIRAGYGTRLIAAFVAQASRRGVIVIAGLPTDFDTVTYSSPVLQTIAGIYTKNGGQFGVLPNLSLYPEPDFFNSEDHLAQPCQFLHSVLVAQMLGLTLNRPVMLPSASILALATTCPFYQTTSAALWPAIRAQASASSSSNNSVNFRIIVPPSSSASTIVTARR